MSWQPEIDDLRRREELAHRMGGPGKIKRQHDGGKLTVSERIERLLDPGSFHEIGAIADPRDTRPLLCEFANLAAPMRKPGPRSFGYRP